MKRYLIEFALWLYETHIQEDWEEYTKLGKIVCYGPWFVRACLIWLTSPFWMISFNFQRSASYAHYQEFGKAMEYEQMRMMAMMQQQNFLNKRAKRQNFKGKKK